MKTMVECFVINDINGTEVDRFEFHRCENHGTINNKSHCLFDGHYAEAYGSWEQIKADMKMTEIIGYSIKTIK